MDYSEKLLATFAPELGNVMYTCTASEAIDLAMRTAKCATGGTGFIVSAMLSFSLGELQDSKKLSAHAPGAVQNHTHTDGGWRPSAETADLNLLHMVTYLHNPRHGSCRVSWIPRLEAKHVYGLVLHRNPILFNLKSTRFVYNHGSIGLTPTIYKSSYHC